MLRNAITLSLHSAPPDAVALCAALGLPEQAPGSAAPAAPEWVHLLPAGEIRTEDGRGPYRVIDAAALIAASLSAGDRLPIDENHSTDLAAPQGRPAPARGWIVELQQRDGEQGGIWGRVEWTAQGRRLVAGRSYRGISPAIAHTKSGEVRAIVRAGLVNRPNLRGLAALHFPGHPAPSTLPTENHMTLLEKLLAAAGLAAGTSEEAAIAAVTALHQRQGETATALQAARDETLGPIATALGLQAGADAGAVLAGVKALKAGNGGEIVTALQAELATVAARLNVVTESTARDKATAFVDGAIKAGTVGVKPLREHYIAMHMADPARVEKELGAMPRIGGGSLLPAVPPANGEPHLTQTDRELIALHGLDPKKFAAQRAAEAGETAL